MENFNCKINLAAFKHVVRKMKNKAGEEVKVIIIPLPDNHVFEGEKGLWVDLTAIAVANPKYDDTHIIKQGLPKEVYEKLTDEEKKNTPIFGNMGPWKNKGVAGANVQTTADIDDDLPF